MKHLSYRDNELFIDSVKALDITDEMFTPFYVYSKSAIQRRISEFKEAFEPLNPIIAYSSKALDNINILRIMLEHDLYVMVVSFGGLTKAVATGFPKDRIIFDGPGKTDEEITKGLYEKPFLFQIGSLFELDVVRQISGEKKSRQNIALRLNLGIDPHVHPYFSEGIPESKFGIDVAGFEQALAMITDSPWLKLKAIGAHLGSQITTIEPYVEEANALIDYFLQAQAGGHQLEFIDVGGGFSIDYEEGEALDIRELAAQLIPIFKEVDARIIFEPGRFLVGDSGLLITRVLGVKPAGNLTFVFVDAGMNDLIRPSFYEAYHEAVSLVIREGDEITADIVGPVSGTGDFLGLGRPLVKPKRGEFLAFLNAGAYCSSMASNYNSRRRAPEVLIDNDDFTVIRHRETWEDLYRNDVLEGD